MLIRILILAAGKDRTGLASALILSLAGLPSDYISREYALTRIGIEPMREFLTAKLTASKELGGESAPILMSIMQCR